MRLYDTRAGELREFVPIEKGRVGIYVCGPTVQSEPHIGHLRSALAYDLLARWLRFTGLEVTLVRNVTDIDDKVLTRAQELQVSWLELAKGNEQLFRNDFSAIGIQEPDQEPRATDHIPQMLELIEVLITRGHAYRALDGSADVYFDTGSWPNYGELTNQRLEDMEGERPSSKKKNAQDFALWKAAKPGEPETASWKSNYGPGRPGWHIECSAMSQHHLGPNFDIHGGGLDLRFPHHENELAQSQAAGAKFANYWIHNGLVTTNGKKMSKSLGNSITSKELLALASPAAVRYYLLSAQYGSALDYQGAVLAEASTALERLHGFLERAQRELALFPAAVQSASLPAEFVREMNEDLNVPAALAVIHDTVRLGNTQLDAARYPEAQQIQNQVVQMLEVLGLAPSQWASDAKPRELDSEIELLIVQRNQARDNKDFARADEIRDQLKAAGIELSDLPSGTHWSTD